MSFLAQFQQEQNSTPPGNQLLRPGHRNTVARGHGASEEPASASSSAPSGSTALSSGAALTGTSDPFGTSGSQGTSSPDTSAFDTVFSSGTSSIRTSSRRPRSNSDEAFSAATTKCLKHEARELCNIHNLPSDALDHLTKTKHLSSMILALEAELIAHRISDKTSQSALLLHTSAFMTTLTQRCTVLLLSPNIAMYVSIQRQVMSMITKEPSVFDVPADLLSNDMLRNVLGKKVTKALADARGAIKAKLDVSMGDTNHPVLNIQELTDSLLSKTGLKARTVHWMRNAMLRRFRRDFGEVIANGGYILSSPSTDSTVTSSSTQPPALPLCLVPQHDRLSIQITGAEQAVVGSGSTLSKRKRAAQEVKPYREKEYWTYVDDQLRAARQFVFDQHPKDTKLRASLWTVEAANSGDTLEFPSALPPKAGWQFFLETHSVWHHCLAHQCYCGPT
ncbi:hypothetical protein C8Q74DRAFT_1221477 [Fomes fomentarius]|nr:hypothetical protein C8Q74DRAFT_1221477 [Fomes fomentarius]